jgi:hypothetical protein
MLKKGVLVLVLGFLLSLAIPSQAMAQQDWGAINSGCTETHTNADGVSEEIPTLQGIECIVANVLSVAIRVLGVGVFLMIVAAGFRYLTAGGDPKAMEAGKNTMTYAIGGLALAVLAWFILQFISGFTGVNLDEFRIPIN